MRYSLQFLPEVEDDVMAAYVWYNAKADAIAEDFLRVFYASAYEITQYPLLYLNVHKNFRRRLIRQFPYALYFTINNNTVIVFGLFHCARNPMFIQSTLQRRDV